MSEETPEPIVDPAPVVRQVVRFALVGVAATAVHYAILIALVELADVRLLVATTIGYIAGIATSYTLNRRFTFQSDAPVASSLLKFVTIYGLGMVLNGAIFAWLTGQGLAYLLAQVIATGIVLVWNFLGARFIAFR